MSPEGIEQTVNLAKRHLIILAPALVALLAAMWAGLLRMGWPLPGMQAALPIAHGPLMVSGFLGTLIGLERAIALSITLKQRWLYAGPILSGAGCILLVIGLRDPLGPVSLTLGSLALVGIFVIMVRRHRSFFVAVMLLGSLTWLVGNALWLIGTPIPLIVWWWVGFLVLTIAGERLELARLIQLSRLQISFFVASTAILIAGLLMTTISYGAGVRISGTGMGLLAFWFLKNDLARRTVRRTGQVRFTAICLLSGYVWLIIAATLALTLGEVTAGLYYDATLHAVFLGFVFAMIFGHAPMIFPGVLDRPISFSRFFYVHLVLLHLSLLLRVVGDILGWLPGRQWGGFFNMLALLLFLVITIRAAHS